MNAKKFFTLLAFGIAAQGTAKSMTFDYQARVTGMTQQYSQMGMKLGDYISGQITYNENSTPNTTIGYWNATYNLDPGSSEISIKYRNQAKSFTESLIATVNDGPVYPHVTQDMLAFNSPAANFDNFFSSAITQSISLNFSSTWSSRALESTSLPSRINLEELGYSGGTISTVNYQGSDGDYVFYKYSQPEPNIYPIYQSNTGYAYVISTGATMAFPLSVNYDVTQRYNEWLNSGKKLSSIESMTFSFTSITPIPEPSSTLLTIAGAIVAAVIAKKFPSTTRPLLRASLPKRQIA